MGDNWQHAGDVAKDIVADIREVRNAALEEAALEAESDRCIDLYGGDVADVIRALKTGDSHE